MNSHAGLTPVTPTLCRFSAGMLFTLRTVTRLG